MDVADIDHNGTWDIYISDLLRNTPLEEPPWGNVLYLGTPSGVHRQSGVECRGGGR